MPLNQHTHPFNSPKQMMSFAGDDSNLAIPQNGNDFLELGCTRGELPFEECWKNRELQNDQGGIPGGQPRQMILEILSAKYQSTFGSTAKSFQPYIN